MKDFTLHTEALAMQEIGFDEPCLAWGLPDITNFVIAPCEKYNGTEALMLQFPLYSQAFRWFREKYNLNIIIFHSKYWVLEIYDLKTNKLIYGYSISETYEEAELACLRKLIEIVKNKQHE